MLALGCSNESCPSHETNLALPTTEKSRAFTINPASVLGFRAIGGGHATASKVFRSSLYTWSGNFELKDPSQPPPFSMPSKLYGEAKSEFFTIGCAPESMFNYL